MARLVVVNRLSHDPLSLFLHYLHTDLLVEYSSKASFTGHSPSRLSTHVMLLPLLHSFPQICFFPGLSPSHLLPLAVPAPAGCLEGWSIDQVANQMTRNMERGSSDQARRVSGRTKSEFREAGTIDCRQDNASSWTRAFPFRYRPTVQFLTSSFNATFLYHISFQQWI